MTVNFRCFILLFVFFAFVPLAQAAAPKLIVILVGDQIRADYLERFHDQLLPDGLRRFRNQGTYYTHAFMDDGVTKTSPGHVLIGSGLYAAQSGIVSNEWYDRASSRTVVPSELIPGGARTRLPWFTGRSFAQRLHETCPACRVVSVSLKDRAALLLTGPDQDEAYWRDQKTREFVSYHAAATWLTQFNSEHQAEIASDPQMNSPQADVVTEQLAEEILKEWRLGHNPHGTDVLTVSFSAVDLVGHRFGPDSPQIKQSFLELDRQVSRLMKAVRQTVRPEVVWVFSSDHGVTPLPEVSRAKGLDAGRVPFSKGSLPHPEWIQAVSEPWIYMNANTDIPAMKTDLLTLKGVAAVYTAEDILNKNVPDIIRRSYYPGRCGDLWVVLKPKYIFSNIPFGTTHGQPTDDDQRVPLGFYGVGIPMQVRDDIISPATIAPTLLKILNVPSDGLAHPIHF